MSEINGFSASASISALLQANRVIGSGTVGSAAPDSRTTPNQTYQFPALQQSRLASDIGPAAFTVALESLDGDADAIRSALAGQLEKIFEVFHGRGKADTAVEAALSSVSELIDAAAVGGKSVSFQIRLATVTRIFGGEDDAIAARAGPA